MVLRTPLAPLLRQNPFKLPWIPKPEVLRDFLTDRKVCPTTSGFGYPYHGLILLEGRKE